MVIRRYEERDVPAMIDIWNEVVSEGNAFAEEEPFDPDGGRVFFGVQTYAGVAEQEDGEIIGLYILHPNFHGRLGHICNASYAVRARCRGQSAGEKLVLDCIERAREAGFRILQFNAVVSSNERARRLYEKLGFQQVGTIPGGFRMKDGEYVDICPYYYVL